MMTLATESILYDFDVGSPLETLKDPDTRVYSRNRETI